MLLCCDIKGGALLNLFVNTLFQIAQLLQQLRLELDQLLQDKIKSPNMNLSTCPRGSKIIDTIVKLLTTQ